MADKYESGEKSNAESNAEGGDLFENPVVQPLVAPYTRRRRSTGSHGPPFRVLTFQGYTLVRRSTGNLNSPTPMIQVGSVPVFVAGVRNPYVEVSLFPVTGTHSQKFFLKTKTRQPVQQLREYGSVFLPYGSTEF